MVSPGMPGYCEGIALPYDLKRARQLLAEAGYPDGRGFPPVDFLVPAVHEQAGWRHVHAQWKQNLGVDISREIVETGELLRRVLREPPHMTGQDWSANYPDPDNFLRVALHGTSVWRYGPYEALVEQARRSMDQRERMRLYRQAEQILADEAPIIVFGYLDEVLLLQPWVKEFPTSPVYGRFFWKDVVIEPH
jgi:oligopeptide transport system substrate-binding protein